MRRNSRRQVPPRSSGAAEFEAEPTRLLGAEDVVAHALRAELEFAALERVGVPSRAQAERVVRRRAARRNAGLGLAAAAVALGLGVAAPRVLRGVAPPPSIVAESWIASPASSAALMDPASSAKHASPAPTDAVPPAAPSALPVTPPVPAGRAIAGPPGSHGEGSALERGPGASLPASGSCRELQRAGDYPAAVECYTQQTRGAGVGAELAWLEKARLERRALRDPAQALTTLVAYQRAFPGGTLRPEATLTRIELLDELGQASQALELIERALADRLAPARDGELQGLKGRLLARSGRCEEADRALAEARRLGASERYEQAVEELCARSR
ncbi:MAG TPA: hypothetical protein VLC09_08995 [Polyangiaceae bacterium]|nr:hypothetical protein [Polyangiaceae bacterium]